MRDSLSSSANSDGSNVQVTDTTNTAPVTASDSLNLVNQYFEFLDRDGNQFLTEEEARVKPHYLWHLNLRDRMTMAAFSNVVDAAQHLSNDELFTEDNGVTKEDLKMLSENLSNFPDIEALITKNLPDPDVKEEPYVPNAPKASSEPEPGVFGDISNDREPDSIFIMPLWMYF